MRWNTAILFEEDIFGAYFPIEKRQILIPCITIRKKGFMGPLSKIWLLEARYLKAFDDQSVKKIGRHLHVDLFRDKLKEVRLENQITSFPIKETLRKIPPPPFYQETPP